MNNEMMPSVQQQPGSVMQASQSSRETAEVYARMQIAKLAPRDEFAAEARILRACTRMSLATQAEYEYQKGGQKIIGPSIRLAEVMAQNWGNIDYGIREVEQRDGVSHMQAYAWDLETNTKRTIDFQVRHERTARGKVTQLTDARDIYETTANQGSRRMRACILGIIPGDIAEAATAKCRETIKNGNKTPLKNRIRNMIETFKDEYSVRPEWLENYIGCKTSAFSENDFIRLSNVYRSLEDGMSDVESYFGKWMAGDKTDKAAASSSTQAEFEAAKAKAEAEAEKKGEQESKGQSGKEVDKNDPLA